MTSPTSSSTGTSQSSQQSNASASARQTNNGSAGNKTANTARTPAELFANLLGMLSATNDEPTGLTAFGIDPIETHSSSLLDSNGDPAQPSLEGSANPLADLLGWPGAGLNQPLTPKKEDSLSEDLLPKAAQAPAGDAKNPEGISLQGMTVLSKPEAIDTKLPLTPSSAQSGKQAAPETSPVATKANEEDAATIRFEAPPQASRTNQWRSTATLGISHAGAAANSSPARLLSSTAHLQSTQHAVAQQSIGSNPFVSTVRGSALGVESTPGNFSSSSSSSSDTTAVELGNGLPGAPANLSQGGPSTGQGGQGEAAFGMHSSEELTGEQASEDIFSMDGQEPLDEEALPGETLNPQQIRNASLRVGDGTDEAMDIRLSMEGDAVNVEFLSDNAEVRAGIQNSANTTLSDLMQRSGVQLGGVSVGANSQQPSGQSNQSYQSNGQGNGSSNRSTSVSGRDHSGSDPVTTSKPASKRSDGGPALDVFA